MSERPFMQLYVSDFVGDTLQLSTERGEERQRAVLPFERAALHRSARAAGDAGVAGAEGRRPGFLACAKRGRGGPAKPGPRGGRRRPRQSRLRIEHRNAHP
ncbi:hypothetical protein FJ527_25925 [Mesorhizobium sp. B2-4-18]|nr:hypothetical protein FJ527_25925 [Mesorhizobium sp. B2-4-18]